MQLVQPIRDKQKIEEIKSVLKENGTRDLLLFSMGINIGLRISDLLKLKIADVRNKSHVEIKEQKIGVINALGRVFMPPIDSPFECADRAVEEMKSQGGENLPIFVDFHAEATSEKLTIGTLE